jgi:predicted transcriptional regulator
VKRKDMEKVEGTLQTLFSSPVRTMILVSLKETPKTLSMLSSDIGFAPGTVYHRLRELKRAGFVEKKEGLYSLTTLGGVGTLKACNTLDFISVMEKYKKFLLSHETDALPQEFLLRLSELSSTDLSFEGVDPLRPIAYISDVFEKAQTRIWGISNIGTSEWARILERKAEEGTEISLLVTDEVYKKIEEKSALLSKDVSILMGKFRFVLVLTEGVMLLALRRKDILDMTNIIVGKDIKSLTWGAQLFLFERQGALSKRI